MASGTVVGGPVSATDPDDDTLTYSLSGTDASAFNVTSGGGLSFKNSPNYESPADSDKDNDYELLVNVSDGKNAQGNDDSSIDASIEVTVKVSNLNETPYFETWNLITSLEVRENRDADWYIGDEIEAKDPDGDTLTYSLTGSDASVFKIGSSDGQIKIKEALDYETKSRYTFKVRASDPGDLYAEIEGELITRRS